MDDHEQLEAGEDTGLILTAARFGEWRQYYVAPGGKLALPPDAVIIAQEATTGDYDHGDNHRN